jgi:hypothetical protein
MQIAAIEHVEAITIDFYAARGRGTKERADRPSVFPTDFARRALKIGAFAKNNPTGFARV